MYAEARANLNQPTETLNVQATVSQWGNDENHDDGAGNGGASSGQERAQSGQTKSGVNMNQDPYGQYQQSSYDQVPEAGNPTYTEAWALVESARRMALPLEYGDLEEEENRTRMRDALRLNWRLWTIFQTELSLEEEGPVPGDIRESMLSLCNFVDKHTVDTINEPTPEKIATLIEINRNIANGLLTSLHNALDTAEAEEHAAAPTDGAPAGPETAESIDTDA